MLWWVMAKGTLILRLPPLSKKTSRFSLFSFLTRNAGLWLYQLDALAVPALSGAPFKLRRYPSQTIHVCS